MSTAEAPVERRPEAPSHDGNDRGVSRTVVGAACKSPVPGESRVVIVIIIAIVDDSLLLSFFAGPKGGAAREREIFPIF